MSYIERLVEDDLMAKMAASGAVLIKGPKSCGKTETATDLTIKALAALIQRIVGHTGEIIWDSTKPDGTPRKLMDVSNRAAATK